MAKIRLYIPHALSIGQSVSLNEEQSHYLFNVMKVKKGDRINCFDGQSGEYVCEVIDINKKHCCLNIIFHEKPYYDVPDIWLLFAPVKKDNTDFIIQKSVELGVKKIIPVITRYTITDKIKKERFEANAVEAAEQCRRTDIPLISDAVKFDKLFAEWNKNRTLYYMDETLNGLPVGEIFKSADTPCAILVGPEGGFSEEELRLLRSFSFAKGVKLGNRILRAETAVVAALSCWQALSGDWQ